MYLISRLTTVWFIVIGLALVLFATGCDPYQVVTVENRTSFPIKADIGTEPLDYSGTPRLMWEDPVVVIEAGQSQRFVAPISKGRSVGSERKYPVVAIAETGEVVFYRVFTWDELHDMAWRVVIY